MQLLRELLAFDLLLQHIEEVYRVGRHFRVVEVEDAGEDLEREAGRQAIHPFVHAGVVAILLIAFRLGIRVFEALAIIDPHLGVEARVFRLLEA